MDTVSLRTNSAEIIGFTQGEQTTTKAVAISITEDDIQWLVDNKFNKVY